MKPPSAAVLTVVLRVQAWMTETSMDQSNLTASTLAPDTLCTSSNTSAIIVTCRLGLLHVSQVCFTFSCLQQPDLYQCIIFL